MWLTRQIDGVAWHLDPARADDIDAWIRRHVPGVLERPEAVLKAGRGTRVAFADGLVLKEKRARPGRARARFALRRSASRRAYVLGEFLDSEDIPTALPQAWAVTRRFGMKTADYFLARHVAGESLQKWIKDLSLTSVQRGRIAENWGRLLGQLHSRGVSNRDVKDSNTIVTDASLFAMVLVDLDGARRVHCMTRRRALRDIWSIVRSLTKNGWVREEFDGRLLDGYNSAVLKRARWAKLPESFPDWPA